MKIFNIEGMYWLYFRETKRFLTTYNQTIIAPVVNTLVYFAIFSTVIGKGSFTSDECRLIFIGFIISSIINTAFGNSSSSLIMAKTIGYFSSDIISAPLKSDEIILAHIFACITRCSIVAITLLVVALLFIKIQIINLSLMVFYSISAATLFAMAGLVSGILCKTFEQVSATMNYIISPFSLLSGTFFSIKTLPQKLQIFAKFNPCFYIVDGFRAGFMNNDEPNLLIGIIVISCINLFLYFLLRFIIKKGIGIKT
jgi:ABC-2 type transport system permease protein